MPTLLEAVLSNCLVALALAVVAVTVGRLSRRPALTHALWLLVLIKLITPPLLIVPVFWPEAPGPVAQGPGAPLVPFLDPGGADLPPLGDDGPRPPAEAPEFVGPPVPEPPPDPAPAAPAEAMLLPPAPPEAPAAVGAAAPAVPWQGLAGAVWVGGALAWFGLALVRLRRFGALLRHAEAAPAPLQAEADTLAKRLGLVRCPRVGLVPGAVSPMLWAMGGAPRLLLPAGLLGRLGDDQRATLLAHELAHLRRGDHWVRGLELIVLGLYWWFPLAWWARRELHDAEEACCDAWVVWALPGSPRAYATALVETLDFLAGACPALPPAASGIGPLPLLRRRLTMIMRGTTPRQLTGAGFLAVVGLGALLLPLVPSWAQDPTGTPAPGPGTPHPIALERARQAGQHDLDRARAELERAQAELRAMAAQIDKQRAELERRARQVQEAMERLKQAEAKAAQERPEPKQRPGMPAVAPGDIGQRLGALERKMDQLLREMGELRKAMSQPRPPGGRPGQAPTAQAPPATPRPPAAPLPPAASSVPPPGIPLAPPPFDGGGLPSTVPPR